MNLIGARIIEKIRQKITEMNADPIWRDTIMDYETKLAEEFQQV